MGKVLTGNEKKVSMNCSNNKKKTRLKFYRKNLFLEKT